MAAKTYDEALRLVLKHEGGYTNHPSDPGGPTNFGITIHDYRRYIKANGTAADVKAMKVKQAGVIYKARYWDAQECDHLPAGVDYCVFDYGVNSGIGRSAKVLQRIVGAKVDGKIGVKTLKAVDNYIAAHGSEALIAAICDERLAFLKALQTWPVFGKGWGSRVAKVRRVAIRMARADARAVA